MSLATVLIVDDNRPLARSLQELFTRRSFRAAVAETGSAARALAVGFRPDLVIADVGLPDLTGDELAEQLALDLPGVRVILMSAGSVERRDDQRGSQHVVARVAKPFDPLRLLALAREVLGAAERLALEFPLVRRPPLLPTRWVGADEPRSLAAWTRRASVNWRWAERTRE